MTKQPVSAEQEREAVVAWLRDMAEQPPRPRDTGQAHARKINATFFANAIERGEHIEGGDSQ